MQLREENQNFSLQLVNWLQTKSEWKQEGGNPCSLGEKLLIIEKWFSDSNIKVFSVWRNDNLIGFTKIDFLDRIYLHLYIIKEKRKKGYGYFLLKHLISKYSTDFRKVAVLVKKRTKNFKMLKDSMLMNLTKDKIMEYSVFESRGI